MATSQQSAPENLQLKTTPVAPELLQRLYSSMLKCRMVEERIRKMVGSHRSKNGYYPASGHEAVYVGTTIDLNPGDAVAVSKQTLITEVVAGAPLASIFAQVRERAANGWRPAPRQSNELRFIPPAGSSASLAGLAAGVALSRKLDNQQHVVIAMCGEIDSDSESWLETAEYACEQKLPIVFVAEDYPVEQRKTGGDAPLITVDRNDVIAMYRVSREAMQAARRGYGPTLINCIEWKFDKTPADPILRLQKYLAKHGLWSEETHEKLVEEIELSIEQAAKLAKKKPGQG